MRRVTVTITEDAYARAAEQAKDSEMTIAQWIAWLAETYQSPEEGQYGDD